MKNHVKKKKCDIATTNSIYDESVIILQLYRRIEGMRRSRMLNVR